MIGEFMSKFFTVSRCCIFNLELLNFTLASKHTNQSSQQTDQQSKQAESVLPCR